MCERCPNTEILLVRVRRFFCPYSVSLRIQSQYGKIRTRKNSVLEHFLHINILLISAQYQITILILSYSLHIKYQITILMLHSSLDTKFFFFVIYLGLQDIKEPPLLSRTYGSTAFPFLDLSITD